jgi:hypothetical protein
MYVVSHHPQNCLVCALCVKQPTCDVLSVPEAHAMPSIPCGSVAYHAFSNESESVCPCWRSEQVQATLLKQELVALSMPHFHCYLVKSAILPGVMTPLI